jgi:hypothetical protein
MQICQKRCKNQVSLNMLFRNNSDITTCLSGAWVLDPWAFLNWLLRQVTRLVHKFLLRSPFLLHCVPRCSCQEPWTRGGSVGNSTLNWLQAACSGGGNTKEGRGEEEHVHKLSGGINLGKHLCLEGRRRMC